MKTQDADRNRGPRVLVVDDQLSVRDLLVMELERGARFGAILTAASGIEALHLFRMQRPMLVVLGLALPGMNGPELMAAMRGERRDVRTLVYTGTRNRELLVAGLTASPQGFVHKTEPLQTLREAVTAVIAGNTFLGPLATGLSEELRREVGQAVALPPKLRTVLQMIAEGSSTKQVAARLSLSPKTVEHYRTQITRKLGLKDVASLTRYAVRCGLVE